MKENRRPKLPPNRYITRVDYHRGHYWYVRFQMYGIQEIFSDGVYGGKRKSYAAAVAYRDKMEKKLPYYKARLTAYHFKTTNSKNNTDVIGVTYHRRKRYSRYGDHVNGPYWEEVYVVKWSENGHHRNRSFSVKKWGKRKAYELACAARKKGVGL